MTSPPNVSPADVLVDELLEPDPAAVAALFRCLGDATRLRILRHLGLGEHRVVDLTAHLSLAQSTVSQHLACLRDCGLVAVRVAGRASVYRLDAEPALIELVQAAERLLAATGGGVEACPTANRAQALGRAMSSRPGRAERPSRRR